MKRVFLIVLDSVGAGAAPDAASFGDEGAHTLRSVARSKCFSVPNLCRMGLGRVEGLEFLGACEQPTAAFGRMRERSMGKDTTIGHWEIAGAISEHPLPTYPNGFPQSLIDEFSRLCGRGVLCNRPYSGTDVIRDYGEEHVKTGKLIVYTSADSVFQIAAHEDVIPPEELYEICRTARRLLRGEHGVGRVIARPFVGDAKQGFTRTANRKDFSLEPPENLLPDVLLASGLEVISVGKIIDIFAGRGFSEAIRTHSNAEGMQITLELARRDFEGLCFVNLVDFDMLYGHRNDVDGYAAALSAFDAWLPEFLPLLGEDDVLIVTADHGCDPSDASTDHTREYVPLLVYGKRIRPVSLGTRDSFADVAATVACWLNVTAALEGNDFSDAYKGEQNA